MNKNKFYIVIIISLIVMNLALLIFLFLGKPPRHEKPREIVIHQLNFDKNQIAEYDKLIKKHRHDIMKLDDEIFALKDNLYKNLSTESKANDSLINAISNKQVQVESVHYQHLLAIKKLCKPEQLEDYNNLTNEFGKIFSKLPSRNTHER